MVSRLRELGLRWKEVAQEADLWPETVRRIRHEDPDRPTAERSSRERVAKALHFDGWHELVRAYKRGDVEAGLGAAGGAGRFGGPRDPEADAIASTLDRLALPGQESLRRRVLARLGPRTAAVLAKHLMDAFVGEAGVEAPPQQARRPRPGPPADQRRGE